MSMNYSYHSWIEVYYRGVRKGMQEANKNIIELLSALRNIAFWNEETNNYANANHHIAMAQWRGDVAIARQAVIAFRAMSLKEAGLTPLYRHKDGDIHAHCEDVIESYDSYIGFRAPVDFVYKE